MQIYPVANARHHMVIFIYSYKWYTFGKWWWLICSDTMRILTIVCVKYLNKEMNPLYALLYETKFNLQQEENPLVLR